jgi:hypothetical protein
MITWFSVETAGDRAESTIVTTFTTTGNARMNRAERCRCKQGRGIVADTALSLRRDMINDLGRCDTGGMAGCAIAGIYTQVVKGDTRKGGEVVGVMARRAVQDRRQMIQRLSRGDVTIMA